MSADAEKELIALRLWKEGALEAMQDHDRAYAAQGAMLRSRERGRRTGKWGFDGDGLRLVMAVSIIHDDQISIATRRQIVTAIDAVRQRVEDGETV